MKRVSVVALVVVLCTAFIGGVSYAQGKTYAYISPGPDTWYQRDVDGFVYGAEKNGDKVIVFNSEYNVEKEIANIDQAINMGVDGICMFSFNEQGNILCAQRAKEAGIPVVITDGWNAVLDKGLDVVAAIDFDYASQGTLVAEWMAKNAPNENYVIITGNLEMIPCQEINKNIEKRANELGKNKQLDLRAAHYNPNEAVDVASDLIESGLDFSVMFIMNDDMAAAVIRMLENRNLLNNPIRVVTSNGSPVGLSLIKSGQLAYTIACSPGWEGLIAYRVMDSHVTGKTTEINKWIFIPHVEVTSENIDDPMQAVPWEVNPEVYEKLTEKYFPQYKFVE